MLLLASSVCGLFKWRQFEPELILMATGWYLRFSLSYRDVEELLAEKIFREQVSSVTVRLQLQSALDFVRDGDVFVVTKLDRLARSARI
jgi:hypothetical protein